MEKKSVIIRMAETVREKDRAQLILLQSPYDREFVETFKIVVPTEDRDWDKERKLWSFRAEHHDAVVELIERCFPNGSIAWEDDADELGEQ